MQCSSLNGRKTSGGNLYANPHYSDNVISYNVRSDVMSRRLLLFAALAETERFLLDTPPEHVTLDEWNAYKIEMCQQHVWVDVDIVAKEFCGYTHDTHDFNIESYALYREPLLRVDHAIHRMMQALQDEHVDILRRWLQDVCRMSADVYLGVRFPPAFIALLADLICEHGITPTGCVRQQDPTPHPVQWFPIWVRFGVTKTPDVEQIITGWEPNERQVLLDGGGRFSAEVFRFWKANRGGNLTGDPC